jgi:glycosyltransferase involved in cell wall biosynthesis
VISVCILTKNSNRTLAAALSSVSEFPEVILLDTGSTDDTLTIAKQFPNVRIHHAQFTNFGDLRNYAANFASNDWILALDSDESLSNELANEIHSLPLNPTSVYEIVFFNYFNGRKITGCGWHPESHLRLYNRQNAQFSPSKVHEKILRGHLTVQRLKNPILHTPYLAVSDFLAKMQFYSDLFALENKGKRKSSLWTALVHSAGAFLRSYFFQRGIFLGKEGMIISLYRANVAFYKYLKLAEANRL